MAEGDVLDVHQQLDAALAVPDLPPRVTRVHQDRPNSGLAPRLARPMPVAGAVVGGRRQDALGRQGFRDRVEAKFLDEVVIENATDHWRGYGIENQPVESLAVRCLRRVGMRPGVVQLVAIRRAPTEEAALDGGL